MNYNKYTVYVQFGACSQSSCENIDRFVTSVRPSRFPRGGGGETKLTPDEFA